VIFSLKNKLLALILRAKTIIFEKILALQIFCSNFAGEMKKL